MKTKVERQQEAELRQIDRNARSPKQQLQELEKRGHGHCKEAEKLRASVK